MENSINQKIINEISEKNKDNNNEIIELTNIVNSLTDELNRKEEEIIKIKNNNENNLIAVLAIYKNIIITDFGQEVDEIYKLILLNYNGGTIATTFSHGLMKDTKFDVDLVELNGRKRKKRKRKEKRRKFKKTTRFIGDAT